MDLTPDLMLRAYANGIFPMAEDIDDPHLHWIDPDPRGIIPLDQFHIPRRLRRVVRQQPYVIRVDHDFDQVISRCGATRPGGERTWLNAGIADACRTLYRLGHAHSVEAWRDDVLVGGLYGIALGGAFFGESMFSLAENASKIALVHLVARLTAGGFTLLDSQFITAHLQQFGACEIPRSLYRRQLAEALKIPARFYCGLDESVMVGVLLQSTSQIS
jgi:leucyl/phenylalanyl-tRNA--protein transferase